jgi:hypothetical protein
MGKIKFLTFFLLLLAFPFGEQGFPSEKEREFQKIAKMGEGALTAAAKEGLAKKYPEEKWEAYKFPKYVFIREAVQTGYKIAVKEYQLLDKFPCYCFCQDMGHKNLAYCFLEKGIPGKFDDHASECNICYTQAMRGFLWNELGASEEEMQKAMKELYDK